MQEPDDAQLVAACRTGDPAAWSTLVRRYGAYVHAIALRGYRLDPADAEDVFQEVFARTYDQLDSLRDDGAVRAWLGQLTRRLCVDRLRASARTTPVAEVTEIEAEVHDLDLALSLRDAMARLPEPAREVLDRFFARDESYRTIAAALDIPPGTVASRISRALAALRAEMDVIPTSNGRIDPTGPSSGHPPGSGSAAGRNVMSDEPKKEELEDVEGHRMHDPAEEVDRAGRAGRAGLNEDDEPDVEGHIGGAGTDRAGRAGEPGRTGRAG